MNETTYLEKLAGSDKIKPSTAKDRDANAPIGVATFTQGVAFKVTGGIESFTYSSFTYLERGEGLVILARQDGTELRIDEKNIFAIQYYNL